MLVETVGCQMNLHDAETLSAELRGRGFSLADGPEDADVVVVFTCSVREKPEEKVFSRLGRLARIKKKKPGMIVAVAGCMAERLGPAVFDRAPCVDAVAGPGSLDRLCDFIENPVAGGRAVFTGFVGAAAVSPVARRASGDGSHSAFVSAMTGCGKFCSYCIVPYVRGPERSRPAREVAAQAHARAGGGAREVTLLGQSISAYGRDIGGNLRDLLRAVCMVPGLDRVRFLTSHPADFDPGILPLFGEFGNLCPHLQMPAQSGSDGVLRRMNRGYTASGYRKTVERARDEVPGMEITSDFIVGFPGETDADFRMTLDLIEWAGFRNVFAFKYVPRPGTAAAALVDDVPPEVKQERLAELLAVARGTGRRRNSEAVGKTFRVMVEGPDSRREASVTGRTMGNHIVAFGGGFRPGETVEVRIESASDLTLFGEAV